MRHTVSLLEYSGYVKENGSWSEAFKAAGSELREHGGGVLEVPEGVYITGTIELYSDMELHLSEGATIIGSPFLEEYLTGVAGHNPDRTPWHLITSYDQEHIRITGTGTIDGSGPAFWEKDPEEPGYEGGFIKAHKEKRPSPMVELVRCRDVLVEGVLLTRSPGWTLHVHDCDDVLIRTIRIHNSFWGPNTDGIDLTGVQRVLIEGCRIKTGDDGICLKTTGDSREVRDVTVRDCHIESYCAALKLGCVESVKDMSDISFERCTIHNSSRMLAIYSYRGARIERVRVRDIEGDTKAPLVLCRPIQIEARLDTPDPSQPDGFFHDPKKRIPWIKDIVIEDFSCQSDGRIMIAAGDSIPIEDITLRRLSIEYPCIADATVHGPKAASRQYFIGLDDVRSAQASCVLKSVGPVTIDQYSVKLPESSEVPPDWRFPKRFENGSWESQPDSPSQYAAGLDTFYIDSCTQLSIR